MSEVINGARTSFGPRTVESAAPADVDNLIRQFKVPLVTVAGSADLLVADATDETIMEIPANSFIFDAYIFVTTAFTATTAVSITAGSETDTDGLITAAGVGAKAGLTANSWQQCDGALVGASWGTSDESIVAAWNAADATAVGTADMVVMYIPPLR